MGKKLFVTASLKANLYNAKRKKQNPKTAAPAFSAPELI